LKAQASLEQLSVIAIALAFVAFAFYFASSYSSDSVKISQAQDAVDRLGAAADYVYSLGPNSKEYITVYLPDDMVANVSDKRIVFNVGTTAGRTDVYTSTRADLIGSLPSERGKQKILVEYLASGKVRIGEAGLQCEPTLITRTFDAGENGNETMTIINNADFNATGITAALTGSVSAFSSIGSPPSSLPSGEQGTLGIDFNIGVEQPPGIYGGIIEVDSADDGSCVSQLTVTIQGGTSCPGLCVSQGYSNGTCRDAPASCVANGESYETSFDYTCEAPDSYCCCYPSGDLWGPIVTSINSTPANASASDNVTINAVCNDSSTGNSYIESAELQLDGGSWSAMNASNGDFSTSVSEEVELEVGHLSSGQHVAGVRCTDTANNTGPISYYFFNISMGDSLGPIVTFMNHTEYPTTLTNVTETGSATDEYTGNADIAACYMELDDGPWVNATPTDGDYDSPTEEFEYNFGQLDSGIHTIFAYCVDELSNVGGIFNDTFGVVSVDVMLVLDTSGSMSDPVIYAADDSYVTSWDSDWDLVKTLEVTPDGDYVNITNQLKTSSYWCTVYFEARVGEDVILSGSRYSTSYQTFYGYNIDVSSYDSPFDVDLYLKSSGGCQARSRRLRVTQVPTRLEASKDAAKIFVDIVGNSTQAGLASYNTYSYLNQQLAMMNSEANKQDLQDSIDALSAGGNTCIECGIEESVDELTSVRARDGTEKVIVLLTDGQSNVGNSIDGATYARENDVVVYTIGFGDGVDETELTNIALLTHGEYYYAPDADTLVYIYEHIGQ